MNDPKPTYAVADPDGSRWYYCFPGTPYGDIAYYADGVPMEKVNPDSHYDKWWTVEHKATVIEMERPPRQEQRGWRLTKGMRASADFPRELTNEEYRERFVNEDYDTDPKAGIYERVTEEVPAEREPVDAPTVELTGRAYSIPSGFAWRATLPTQLRERTEYLHLFPGHLEGIHEKLKEMLEAQRGWTVYTHSGWSAQFRINQGEARSGHLFTTDGTRTLRPDLPAPPARISAPDLATALAEFDAIAARWMAVAGEAAKGACSCCGGTGLAGVTPR